jgi:site-specific recombinase XerD
MEAICKAGVVKHIGCHAFRFFFATHLFEAGYDIRMVQELQGHAGLSVNHIYRS